MRVEIVDEGKAGHKGNKCNEDKERIHKEEDQHHGRDGEKDTRR